LEQLASQLLDNDDVATWLSLVLREDAQDIGDITTASIIEPERRAHGSLVSRSMGVVAGMAVVQRYLAHVGQADALKTLLHDGEKCTSGQAIARWTCPLAVMLQHERPVLNLLGRLSGIATLTSGYVAAASSTSAVICDTRKTTPGMRRMEKYAVRCGGGMLHRIGLYDAALYKDNHIAHIHPAELANTLSQAARRVRQAHEIRFVEVEVDSLSQLHEVLAIESGLIDIVLLDNMTIDQMREAVARRDAAKSSLILEASGGVTLDTVREIAGTGVDRIAVGGITHGAQWLDIGLDIEAGT
jgi:nicotinate-nucleotide pyrophosphorylase (carboxylating)